MNIAFLNIYGGKVERGAETFTHELARRLEKKHRVVFFKGKSNILPSHGFSGSLVKQMTKRTFLDTPSRAVFKFTLANIGKIIRSNFDIVIPMNGFWQLLLLKLFQPLGRYKIVVTGHSGPGWDERWNLYLKPDAFVATTVPTRIWATRTAPWTRVEMIPYGIDAKVLQKAGPVSIDLKKPIILCPAALVPYKRIDRAIEAVVLIKEASLLVVGRGGLESKLKRMGKEKLGSRFALTGVAHDKMASLYQVADVVTLPSEAQENSPMVFLESLAAGKPVVTTDSQRNRWLLGDAGIYCNPEDRAQYARTLRQALRLGGQTETKKRIQRVARRFAIRNVARQYEELFHSLTK